MLSIRLNPEIEKQLKLVAKLEGVTVSEYVRRLIVEKMEDMYDLKNAEEAYEELVEINFKEMPSAVEVFKGDLTVDDMIMALRFRFPDKKIDPEKTLIFFDEIQECEEAGMEFVAAMDADTHEDVTKTSERIYCIAREKGK